MSEARDSAIKLFGKTIPVAEISISIEDDEEIDKDIPTENKQENDAPALISEESSNPDETSKTSKTEEQSDSSNSQDKTLKKPDKILPCPRCNSMDTKFCYYNNYNVNQPRHFCKNCQRYWTAGGTMRNVPVGAGRRKNKNSTSHNGVHLTSLKPNGTVLTFGSDPPLHESMASVLNLADKTTRNGFHKPEALMIDETSKSGVEVQAIQNFPGFPPQMPCFSGGPWPYPWSSSQWSSSVPVPPPAFCPPRFPMPFYPSPPYWVPGGWNMPWVPRPLNPGQAAPSSGPNSPTLGKHSREETTAKLGNNGEEAPVEEKNVERCLWIPKTLRIDDPGEAAKSSIWTTLGIKHDKTNSIGGRGLFKAFEPKSDEMNHMAEASSVLQANPAAFSRSIKFHERS